LLTGPKKNPLKITRDEAISIRENCLKGFKDRLIEKANILQARHDEETVQYQKSNSAYVATSSDLTVEEKEKYVVNANNTLFKIGVIEKRLQQVRYRGICFTLKANGSTSTRIWLLNGTYNWIRKSRQTNAWQNVGNIHCHDCRQFWHSVCDFLCIFG